MELLETPLHNPSKPERMPLTFKHASSGQKLEVEYSDMHVGSKEPRPALDWWHEVQILYEECLSDCCFPASQAKHYQQIIKQMNMLLFVDM